PIALLKELIDNGLDACETAGVAPEITVTLDGHRVTVEDNGRGVPLTTIERSLDYTVRVSDKAHYVSPSRGQLGNALKCLWAAPIVIDGAHGRVDVATGAVCYQIEVRLDHVAQHPQVTLLPQMTNIKSGTSITIHWSQEASYLPDLTLTTFYNPERLLAGY